MQHLLYTDDLQIYTQVAKERLNEGVARLRQAAKSVSASAARASLKLNTGKTNAILFSSKKFVNKFYVDSVPCIELEGGVSIPFSNSVKSLGVILDPLLWWKSHVGHLTKKFNCSLYSLRVFCK